ncbi:MAG: hypothetical protein JSR31_06605 [Nitrospira sp.]|nr:hypothetical protein [Nitrospira sp.]
MLVSRYGINPKTVVKWKRRASVNDLPIGPKHAKSTTLSNEDEAIIVALRRTRRPPGRFEYDNNRVQEIVSGTIVA